MDWLRPVGLLLAVLAVGWLMTPTIANATGGHQHGPEVHEASAKGKSCIRPTEWMRRNHMDFLKHRRAETVREGIRFPGEGLIDCQQCHTSRTKFCDRCHSFAGVKPDCFECHNYPK
ncbi:Hdr-like menaquinol oxidoreductase cytochrome c subunit [Magnetococcales bacterium HHB-1]